MPVTSTLGTAINSGPYDGLATDEFKQRITAELHAAGLGRQAANYKLRDWLFSRQRFWGEPFPILHELDDDGSPTGLLRAVDAAELPVDLPHLDDYKPHGRPEPPLMKAPADVAVPGDRRAAVPAGNQHDAAMGRLVLVLPAVHRSAEQHVLCRPAERTCLDADRSVCGRRRACRAAPALRAVLAQGALRPRTTSVGAEPFQRLVNQGMILGEMEFTGYRTESGQWINPAQVTRDADGNPVDKPTGQPCPEVSVAADAGDKQGESFVLAEDPSVRVDSRAYKMSKSRGNVVNPDEIVQDFGADSLRLYEMFMGPLEATKPWSMQGVKGVRTFLDRGLADDRGRSRGTAGAQRERPGCRAHGRAEPGPAPDDHGGHAGH